MFGDEGDFYWLGFMYYWQRSSKCSGLLDFGILTLQ